MSSDPQLAVIVLAAGNSSRLGQDKTQLILDGSSLLSRTLALAHSLSDQVFAVIRPEGVTVSGQMAIGDRVKWLVNPEPDRGMGSSIATGVAAVGNADGALILLVDQYQVEQSQLAELCSRWQQQPDSIAACRYAETVGPPIIFPLRCFAKLAGLNSGGAKPLLADERLLQVDLPEAAFDLDTPADLLAFRAFARD